MKLMSLHLRRLLPSVKNLVRISEGGFNRVLLATMKDGFGAIVKVPYRISVPKTYATAREVATLHSFVPKGYRFLKCMAGLRQLANQ